MPIVLARIEFQVQDIFEYDQVSVTALKEEFSCIFDESL